MENNQMNDIVVWGIIRSRDFGYIKNEFRAFVTQAVGSSEFRLNFTNSVPPTTYTAFIRCENTLEHHRVVNYINANFFHNMNLHAFINHTPPRQARAIRPREEAVEEDWFAEIEINQPALIQPALIQPALIEPTLIEPAPIILIAPIIQQQEPPQIDILTNVNQINLAPISTITPESTSQTTNNNQINTVPTATITTSLISTSTATNQDLYHRHQIQQQLTVHHSTIGTSTDHINSYTTSTQTINNNNTISTQTITAAAPPAEPFSQNSFGEKASASKCPVCYDNLATMDSGLVKILPCFHIMCSNCIHGIMAFTDPPFLCPLCRDEFVFNNIRTLILP